MSRLILPDWMRAARVCVAVPTTAQRLRERGYNQALLLAQEFAAQTGREAVNALARTGSRSSQTTLQPLARRANVAGAFQSDAREAARVRGIDVLLIDDVLTTGATASACALVLSAAGAQRIALITFARALDARRLTRFNGVGDDIG
jgi:predicted amidophosphoribosyltransferase